ncbi:hypothetical protein AD928_05830 [Acetobacter cerevisiae]|uniref:HPP transmembrane region domain-containing protein n=1 Tax=Acetobacter cerevisiae TaxID=178900 RepID=A0A149QDU8_9PROT|nr:hypothetical protein AD928_05830 [Acetobacter cerevisiae]
MLPFTARGGYTSFLSLAVGLGAVCGILASLTLTGLIAPAALPAIVAPIGASSVLVFAIPASPLAKPYAVIMGNILSAAIGVLVSIAIPHQMLAAGLAVGLAIIAMTATRSLHPPGGAAALTAVLLHPSSAGPTAALLFPLVPVGLNSLILVCVGIAFHRLSGRSYPHHAMPPSPTTETATELRREDILAALHKTGEAFDIELEDLERLLTLAEEHRDGRGAVRIAPN